MVSTLVHGTNITRKMFKPGNKYGALTKRGVNKTSKETKELINEILFNREDALKLLQMTENGEEQVGGEIVLE